MISISNLSKSYSTRVLFENVTFTVGKNEKIGLVGRNGSGKTTLLKILSNLETSDFGNVIIPKNYSIGYLQQHLKFSKSTIVDELLSALPKSEQDKAYVAEKMLFGLGFEQNDLARSPDEFSGGYQIRINLGKLLIVEHNLVLLDEPTNYLDIVSIEWLKDFLRNYAGEFILITHDRDFMDSVCNFTMGINSRGIKKIKGGTFKYYERLELERELGEI